MKEEMNVTTARGNSNRHLIRLSALAVFAALALIVAGHSGSARAAAAHTASSVAVKTRKIKGLGTVLVNTKGRTLYVFMKDAHSRVTCTGSCAQFWPPLKWRSSGRPRAGGSAKSKLLSSDPDPAGGKVVTYNKWPLYTYAGDSAAGDANGQGVDQSGGKWYVISAGGKVVKHS